MQSGQTGWRIPHDQYYMGPPGYGSTYRIMHDGSCQVLGAPDWQTPVAALRVGYRVIFPVSVYYPTGATLTVTAIGAAPLSGPGNTAPGVSGGWTSNDPWTATLSDTSTWSLKAIVRLCTIADWTARDLSQTQ